MQQKRENILLKNTKQAEKYTSINGGRGNTRYPIREDIKQHGIKIKKIFEDCLKESNNKTRLKDGVYLEFSSMENYNLTSQSLESFYGNIHLLNSKTENNIEKATIYIPKGKESVLLKKIEDYNYKTNDNTGKPYNFALINSIENISIAIIESFWTSKKEFIPQDINDWCELWILYDIKLTKDKNILAKKIADNCSELGIEISKNFIEFPERIVFQINVNSYQLSQLILQCEYISEIRKANIPTNFFINSSHSENKQWIQNLMNHIEYHESNTYICLLDTGLNFNHPLIKPTIKSERHIQAIKDAWGNADLHGHGTEMAGIAIYNSLNGKIHDDFIVDINHNLESIKIIPNSGINQKEFYGYITQQAVSKAEIENPKGNRIFCMAITAPQISTKEDGFPTSWSSIIDKISSNANEDSNNKLFLISAGNITPNEFDIHDQDCNANFPIEDPGQSWNAITIGAYAGIDKLTDKYYLERNYKNVVNKDDLSPYSRCSTQWESNLPIKPEVLFFGGNMITNGNDNSDCEDFSLITTSNNIASNMFSTINATSSATAQASYLSAKIYSAYPNIWPETIRALIIHSASWTNLMIEKYANSNIKNKGNVNNLIRHCGYGKPDLLKAIQCAENSVNLIIEEQIKPFYKGKNSYKTNMHYHKLPWPKSELIKLNDKDIKIKITLSYFIEPGPEQIGRTNKYRYQSCGLRFAIKDKDETETEFKQRINRRSREENPNYSNSVSQKWIIGPKNRDVGSIHSDYLEGSAIEFIEMDTIAIYPVIGWWKTRTNLKKFDKSMRYSLIVSLETPETETNLYTAIINQIPSGKAIISNTIDTPNKETIEFKQGKLF